MSSFKTVRGLLRALEGKKVLSEEDVLSAMTKLKIDAVFRVEKKLWFVLDDDQTELCSGSIWKGPSEHNPADVLPKGLVAVSGRGDELWLTYIKAGTFTYLSREDLETLLKEGWIELVWGALPSAAE